MSNELIIPLPFRYPEKDSIWRHFKGTDYKVISIALDSDDLTWQVIYQRLDDSESNWWIRDVKEWYDVVESESGVIRRFTYVGKL